MYTADLSRNRFEDITDINWSMRRQLTGSLSFHHALEQRAGVL